LEPVDGARWDEHERAGFNALHRCCFGIEGVVPSRT
jgi:hypothetical protein